MKILRVDNMNNTPSSQKSVSKKTQIQTAKLSQEELHKCFQESRNEYKKMLDKAGPIPSSVLTIPRINSLHAKNSATISFLSDFHQTIREDYKEDLCIGVKSMLEKYLQKLQDFCSELNRL